MLDDHECGPNDDDDQRHNSMRSRIARIVGATGTAAEILGTALDLLGDSAALPDDAAAAIHLVRNACTVGVLVSFLLGMRRSRRGDGPSRR